MEKRYDKASESYEEVLKINPKNETASFNLANTHYRSDVLDKAKELYETLSYQAKDPEMKQSSFYNLGNLYFKNRDYAKAMEAYKSALRLNPKDKRAKHNLELAMKNKNNQQNQESSPSPENKKDSSKDPSKKQSENQNKGGSSKNPNQQDNPNSPPQEKENSPMTKEEAEMIMRMLDNKDRASTKYKIFSGEAKKSDEPW